MHSSKLAQTEINTQRKANWYRELHLLHAPQAMHVGWRLVTLLVPYSSSEVPATVSYNQNYTGQHNWFVMANDTYVEYNWQPIIYMYIWLGGVMANLHKADFILYFEKTFFSFWKQFGTTDRNQCTSFPCSPFKILFRKMAWWGISINSLSSCSNCSWPGTRLRS